MQVDNLLLYVWQEEHSQVSVTGKRGDAHSIDLSWTKQDISKIDLVSRVCIS